MQQAESLIEFRKVLELGLVSLAAEKATEDDWETAERVLLEVARASLTFTSALAMPTFAFTRPSLPLREILWRSWSSRRSLLR